MVWAKTHAALVHSKIIFSSVEAAFLLMDSRNSFLFKKKLHTVGKMHGWEILTFGLNFLRKSSWDCGPNKNEINMKTLKYFLKITVIRKTCYFSPVKTLKDIFLYGGKMSWINNLNCTGSKWKGKSWTGRRKKWWKPWEYQSNKQARYKKANKANLLDKESQVLLDSTKMLLSSGGACLHYNILKEVLIAFSTLLWQQSRIEDLSIQGEEKGWVWNASFDGITGSSSTTLLWWTWVSMGGSMGHNRVTLR